MPQDLDQNIPPMLPPKRTEMFPVPEGACEFCNKRPATSWWVGDGGIMSFVHGGGIGACERCCTEEQLKHARAAAERIPELERKLAELP